MSGLTEANFQSSRKVPVVTDWLTVVVMEFWIVVENWYCWGPCYMLFDSYFWWCWGFHFFFQWNKASEFCTFSMVRVMYILLLELFFICCILFRKNSANLFGRSGGRFSGWHWIFILWFFPWFKYFVEIPMLIFYYHLFWMIYVFFLFWSDAGASYILSWYVDNLEGPVAVYIWSIFSQLSFIEFWAFYYTRDYGLFCFHLSG